MFSVLKHDDVAIRSLFCVHCWKSFRLNISNEKQLLSFTSWAHNEMTSKVLQATKWGCAAAPSNPMRSLRGEYIQMLRHYFIKSLFSVHLMWGRESGERCCVSIISYVIFLSSANVIVHSSQQKCDFVNVETYTAKMFYALWWLKKKQYYVLSIY